MTVSERSLQRITTDVHLCAADVGQCSLRIVSFCKVSFFSLLCCNLFMICNKPANGFVLPSWMHCKLQAFFSYLRIMTFEDNTFYNDFIMNLLTL